MKRGTRTGLVEWGLLLVLALALLLPLSGPRAQTPSLGSPPAADPQTTPAGPTHQELEHLPDATITPAAVEKKIAEITSATDLDEDAKAKLLGLYQKVSSNLETIGVYEGKTTAYTQTLETAPGQIQEIRDRLGARAPDPELPSLTGLSVREIEQRLTRKQADIAAVAAQFDERERELETWAQRSLSTRDRLAAAMGERERLDAESSPPLPVDASPLFTEAHRWALQTQRGVLSAEIHMLEQDLLSHAVRYDLLETQRDELEHRLTVLRTQEAYLNEQLDGRRQLEAEQAHAAATAAKREVAGKHPILEALAERNARLTEEMSDFAAALGGIDEQQAQVVMETKRIGDEMRNSRQRMELMGLTQSVGQLLIDRRRKLPDLRLYHREAKEREHRIAATMLGQLRYQEEAARLRNPDAFIDTATVDSGEPLPPELRDHLRELTQQRLSLLGKATTAADAYLRALSDLDQTSGQLMETISDYGDYLDEHILWVRSALPVSLATLHDLPADIVWFFSPSNWLPVFHVLVHKATVSPWLWLSALGPLLLLWRARAIRYRILATARPRRREPIGFTLEAIGLTFLLAVPASLLLAILGWQLHTSLELTPFAKAVGHGTLSAAFGLFSLRAFRLLCIPGGVADRHFGWSSQTLKIVRRNFDWVIWLLVPVGFIIEAAHSYQHSVYAHSLGRVALLVIMVGFAFFIGRLAHPRRGAFGTYLAAYPRSRLSRLSWFWYPLIVATPLVLAVLALLGYVYTANVLMRSLVSEFWLILGLVMIHQFGTRWLAAIRRRTTLHEVRRQRAERKQREVDPVRMDAMPPIAAPRMAPVLATQHRKLLNSLLFVIALVSLWSIYSDILPALAVFEDISLWAYTGTLDGQEHILSVTVADIGLILIIAGIAAVTVKNLPALMDILWFRCSPVSSGDCYTIKTLVGYGTVIAAALAIFNILGLSWSQVQWLVAALGVGIGFGLQEIVANFISGLILLFERPIRVGDVVTIQGTTGVVTQIRIRATVVRSWDKQELLVPNKELITGNLLNWTLSDQVNRIVIAVGVDREIEIPKAMDYLYQIAAENEQVLDNPKPLVTAEDIGANVLTLVLRCHLNSLENRLAVISQLHQGIDEKFRAEGIAVVSGGKAREG
ncbi:MAG: mechanosensitive ion channel [Candidatus Thiosymbion ectosymbiont of Robbea hypermnestra]|nr:mechanosensitive ion channel [Candidatus Thiosymbion ectosymbiont of Robbea hypermnestra]